MTALDLRPIGNINTFDSKTPVFSKVVLLRECYHIIKGRNPEHGKKDTEEKEGKMLIQG